MIDSEDEAIPKVNSPRHVERRKEEEEDAGDDEEEHEDCSNDDVEEDEHDCRSNNEEEEDVHFVGDIFSRRAAEPYHRRIYWEMDYEEAKSHRLVDPPSYLSLPYINYKETKPALKKLHPIHIFARDGHVDALIERIQEDPSLLNLKGGESNASPLIIACMHSHEEMIPS